MGAVVVLTSCTSGTFVVDRTDDAASATACTAAANDCSLRGAVLKANMTLVSDRIIVPIGTYVLTVVGIGENAAATGDLDILFSTQIDGDSSGTVFVDGSGMDRIFEVDPAQTGIIDVSITGMTIRNGFGAINGGGGIRNWGNLTLIDCVVTENRAGYGGGIYTEGPLLTIDDSVVSRNDADFQEGGGIASGYFNGLQQGGDVKLTDTTVTLNSAATGGGGISFYAPDGELHLKRSTIDSNYLSSPFGWEVGGGIALYDGLLTMLNSTLSDNHADDFGGGLWMNDGTASSTNVTFAENSSTTGSGVHLQGGTLTFGNTLMEDGCVRSGGSLVSDGGNLESTGNTCSFTDPSDQVNVPFALIGPLAPYGGLTDTHALIQGSPAIDTGRNALCPINDQRFYPRTVGACDVGAFEFDAVP
jgi:hypothetical protein